MKLTEKEIRDLVYKAHVKHAELSKRLKDSPNPQIVISQKEAETISETLWAVFCAMKNNSVLLKLLADGD